jgi:zinc protease
LAAIVENGVNEQDLHNVQESYLRQRETSLKENSFWLNVLSAAYREGRDIKRVMTYNDRVKGITSKKLQKLAKKYFQKGIKMQFVLLPKEQAK